MAKTTPRKHFSFLLQYQDGHEKNLHPHLVLGCIRFKIHPWNGSWNSFICSLSLRPSKQGSPWPVPVSLEGLANLTVWQVWCSALFQKAFWGSMAPVGSPHQEWRNPHSSFYHEKEWSSWGIPFPAHAMITISTCRLPGRFFYVF